jgi:hypothetical protein
MAFSKAKRAKCIRTNNINKSIARSRQRRCYDKVPKTLCCVRLNRTAIGHSSNVDAGTRIDR